MSEELANTPIAPAVTDGPAPAPRHAAQGQWPLVWAALLLVAALSALAARAVVPVEGRGLFLPSLCLVICILAAWFDAATTRIPNPLTYTAILLGLFLNSLTVPLDALGLSQANAFLGATGLLDALKGFGACAAIAIACRLFAGMAGGDMKLLAAVGALIGFNGVPLLLLTALLIATPYALINLILSGGLNAVMRVAALQLLSWVYLRQPSPIEPPSTRSIPLAVPLLLGLLLSPVIRANQWLWSGL